MLWESKKTGGGGAGCEALLCNQQILEVNPIEGHKNEAAVKAAFIDGESCVPILYNVTD